MSARSPLICSAVELWYKKMLKIGSLSELTGIDTKIKVAGFQRLYSKWLWLLMAVYKPLFADKVLLNKILFYLWNDVCKDGEGDIFKVGEAEDISFSELYGENGAKMLKRMMSYLGVTDPDGNKVTTENNEENTEL